MNQITYRCEGQRVFLGHKRMALSDKVADIEARINAALESDGDKAEVGPLERKRLELAAEFEALTGDDSDYVGRAGCGEDLTKQIEAVPADGEVYEYVCPKCGNVGSVRKAVPTAAETVA